MNNRWSAVDELDNIICSMPFDSETRQQLSEWRTNNLELLAVKTEYFEEISEEIRQTMKQSAIRSLMESVKERVVSHERKRNSDGTLLGDTFYIYLVKKHE